MEQGLLSLKWNNHICTFFKVLETIRKKELFCDVTIACEGKYFSVHKLVLSTCSDYFQEIFERTECKHPVIVLKDVRQHDFECLLNYMYLGEVNVLQDDLSHLIKAAECLKVKGLAVPDDPPLQEKKNNKRSDKEEISLPSKRNKRISSSSNVNSSNLPNSDSSSSIPTSSNIDVIPQVSNNLSSHNNNKQSSMTIKEEKLDYNELDSSQTMKREPSDVYEDFYLSDDHVDAESPQSESTLPKADSNLLSPTDIELTNWPDEGQYFDHQGSRTNESGDVNFSSSFQEPSSRLHNSQDPIRIDSSVASNTQAINWNSFLHKDEKGWSCHYPQCGYSSLNKEKVRVHIRTHTGEKPYVCKFCPYRSNQGSNLHTHYKKYHSMVYNSRRKFYF